MDPNIATLEFRDVQELLDFEQEVRPHVLITDQEHLCISGNFTDAEIELARHGYHAQLRTADSAIF